MAQRISSDLLVVRGALYADGLSRSRRWRPPRPLLIERVHVVDATGGPMKRDRAVCVRDGCVDAIAPAGTLPAPAAARTIDAAGGFLIPGLWDMHVSLRQAGESSLPLLVAQGVTSVRDMDGSLGVVDDWRAQIEAGVLIGPRILTPGRCADDEGWSRPRRGRSVHDELEVLVRGAGLSPLQAIAGATRACAEHFGLEHELGTIESGRIADLVLLDADPLEDIRHTRRIRAVIRGGRLLARRDLDRLVRQAGKRSGTADRPGPFLVA